MHSLSPHDEVAEMAGMDKLVMGSTSNEATDPHMF